MDRPSRWIAPLVVAGALLAPSAATAQESSSERTLSVVGSGEAELTPDRGNFEASVVKQARSAEAARAAASRVARRVAAAVRRAGVPAERIATDSVSVRRRRVRERKTGPVRIRYRASQSFSVRVDGIDVLQRALDAATRAGATSVYGPDLSFTPARRAEGQRAAEAAALTDARSRAESAAASQGQRIVGIKSIDLDPGQGDDYSDFSLAAAGSDSARAPETPIFAGKQTFTSLARVTYVIEAAG